jgi:hypothetical protein
MSVDFQRATVTYIPFIQFFIMNEAGVGQAL